MDFATPPGRAGIVRGLTMSALPPLSAWSAFAGLLHRPLDGGLINDTYAVGDPPAAVVQRLHPIFRPEVNLDIDAVTAHLDAQGFPTPRPLRTDTGDLWTVDGEGRSWRALSWVPGVCHARLGESAMAKEAGSLVGRWHRATSTLAHRFHFSRPGAHDTALHVANLRSAVEQCRGHRLWEQVAPVADAIDAACAPFVVPLPLPQRLVHGDLKVSNLRFTEAGRGLTLLDLDTMAFGTVEVELGDALRSWCNRRGEDTTEPLFDAEFFGAAARGWIDSATPSAEEREALPHGLLRIALELAARFLADALRESYFGWNPAIAPARGEHNLIRGLGQWALHQQVRSQQGRLRSLVRA